MRGRKRRNDIDSSEFENVVTLYKNKISLKQIAFDYDVTAYVVRDVLVGMGVEIGPRGRPWKHHPAHSLKRVDDNTIEVVGTPLVYVKKDAITQDDNDDGDLLNLAHFRRPLGE